MTEDKDKALEFIENYRHHQLLWDPNLIEYTNKNKRQEALAALARKHDMDVRNVKNKIKNLRSYFSKEHQRVTQKKRQKQNYESTWFAYKAMSFILDAIPKDVKNIPPAPEESQVPEPTIEDHEEMVRKKIQEIALEQLLEKSANAKADDSDIIEIKTMPASDGGLWIIEDKVEKKKRGSEPEKKDKCGCGKNRPRAEDSDECDVFGQLIAHKLRGLNTRNRVLAQKQISSVFFDIELEQMEQVPVSIAEPIEAPDIEIMLRKRPRTTPPPPKEPTPVPEVFPPEDVIMLNFADGVAQFVEQSEAQSVVPNLPTLYQYAVTVEDCSSGAVLSSRDGELLVPKQEVKEFTIERRQAEAMWQCQLQNQTLQ